MDAHEFRRYLDEHSAVTNETIARSDEIVAEIKENMTRRSNEIITQNREAMARSDEQRVEFRQAMAEHREAMQDIRFELSQMSLRGERVAQGFIDELRLHRGVLTDLVAENGAQREALFAILDEMRGGGPAAPGA
jgi:hypothetical protein